MWNHTITTHTGRYRQQSFYYYGLFFSNAEVTVYVEYQLRIKGTVLYFWCSLRCIKCWIVFYCRGLRFPQRAVFLLLLENDVAYTGWNGHLAWKSAVLILEWCSKAIGDREQDLWRCGLPEGCITKRYDKSKSDDCLSKKCWLGEERNNDIAVSHTLAKQSNIQRENQHLKHGDSHHWPEADFGEFTPALFW